LIAAGVLAGFLALLGIGQWILAEQRDDLKAERDANASRNLNLKKLDEDSGDVAALKEWDQTTVPWLDELYDLSARMDFRENFRLTRLNMSPAPKRVEAPGKKATGPAYSGLITVTGTVPESQDFLAS